MAFTAALKVRVKKKAHFQCCLCHTLGVEVHHIVPQEEDGPDTEDNAAPLCPSCHETHGPNPAKRRFIREARDFWYATCSKRYASDKDLLDRIAGRVDAAASKRDLQKAVDRILGVHEVRKRALSEGADLPERRSDVQVLEAIEEFFDKVWYDRHQGVMQRHADGTDRLDPKLLATARKAAPRIERKDGRKKLGPWSGFEWGMLNGKLSALRWVLGDEWDMLDT